MSDIYRNSKIKVYNGTGYDQYYPETDYHSVRRAASGETASITLQDELLPSSFTITTAVGTKSLNNKYIVPIQWPEWMKRSDIQLQLDSAIVFDGTSSSAADMTKLYFYGPETALTHTVGGEDLVKAFLYCYDSGYTGKPITLSFSLTQS